MSKFEHISADKLVSYLKGRSYKYAQVHHTWKPNHADFTGSNHISLQQGMYNYHVNTNGWSDIGQHVTLFPDGTFVTGRPFSKTPAGIKGYNTGSFMVEIIGDFDKGKDKLEGDQLKSALKVYQYLVNHNGASILFHNEHAPKSCPGTGIDKAKFVKAVKNFDGKTVDVSSSNVSKPPKKPTSKPNSSGGSVVDYLVSKGINSSFANRKKLASKHGISNYKGTASQNVALLNKLKGGKPASKPSKSVKQMASEVKKGLHGNGHANRRKSLGVSNAKYQEVRNYINKGGSTSTKKPVSQMAQEIIDGKHGSGHANRRKSLGISNAEYQKVRSLVNKRM